MTANWLTIWGFGQYAVVKGRGDRRAPRSRGTRRSRYVVLGVISLGLIALFGGRLTRRSSTRRTPPRYVPGMALAIYIRRLGAMPERVLTRQHEVPRIGLSRWRSARSTYTVDRARRSPRSAAAAWSIVYANIVQSLVVVADPDPRRRASRAGRRRRRCAGRASRTCCGSACRSAIQGIAHTASRYWDNLDDLALLRHRRGRRVQHGLQPRRHPGDPGRRADRARADAVDGGAAARAPPARARALDRAAVADHLPARGRARPRRLSADRAASCRTTSGRTSRRCSTVLACLSVFRPITWVLSAYLEAMRRRTG